MLLKPDLPLCDVFHRPLESVPDRTGAVCRRQTTAFHVFKDRAAPFRNYQAIYDDGVLVQIAHKKVCLRFIDQFTGKLNNVAGWANQRLRLTCR